LIELNMLIAKEKRKTNIAEYILYMWQLEDMLRALRFDSELIRNHLVKGFNQPGDISEEITEWYVNLASLMKSDGVEQHGHIQVIKNLLNELNDLHLLLLSRPQEMDYINTFQQSLPFIKELKSKQKETGLNDIEVCLNGLYGLLLLRIQKKEISDGTEKSMQVIAGFVAKLSAKYLQYEKGEIEFD
jgi:hypothetical protein